VSRRGQPVAGVGRHSRIAARQQRRTAARERRGQGNRPPATIPADQLAETARRLREEHDYDDDR
jgi:hypothetical protein